MSRRSGVPAQAGEEVALRAAAKTRRNGVGKTTLILTLVGLTRVHAGTVRLGGRDVTRVATSRRAQSGLGWVPQERRMWPTLTVEEHLSSIATKGEWTLRKLYEMLPRLEERRRNYGSQLSGGEQQMVAIARALATNPRLLLLDEPMEGLAPLIVQELLHVFRQLMTTSQLSIVLIEQHARLALSLTRRAIVLDRGKIVHTSDSGVLSANSEQLHRLIAVA